jgi:hypothetical protein
MNNIGFKLWEVKIGNNRVVIDSALGCCQIFEGIVQKESFSTLDISVSDFFQKIGELSNTMSYEFTM